MSNVLNALDAVVQRFGPDTAADPVALAGALRAITDPPSEREIAALENAAAGGAVARMAAAVRRGEGPEEALEAAAAEPAARWACLHLGAASGLLPREWATGAVPAAGDGPATTVIDTPPSGLPVAAVAPPARRRGIALAAIGVLVVAGIGTSLLLTPREDGSRPAGVAALPSTAAPVTAGGATTAPPQTATAQPADPRSVFRDPALLALAEPYLDRPGVTCAPRPPTVNAEEIVTCIFAADNVGALFTTFLSAEVARGVRASYLGGIAAAPGTLVRSLRWKEVPDRPGVRAGLPVALREQGVGLRVRYLTASGTPSLYFDRDDTRVAAVLFSTTKDLDDLRAFWADPDS